ncbi:SRPBCC family protein [Chelativorans sp. EGI FJ00035]|uniref:SRPBCC family protein n=1 Tax=Chelativorans salis TaxID=2978478 RepID=A0ABT2LP21_9HYPH|nr:SRPBCC family protein [Chelativorans sp. EGI FJ00035]
MTIDPRAKAEMLIRKPVAEVFEAFVDPEITSKFWFTGGSGRMEAGKTVTWEWAMYSFSIPVEVKAVEKNRRILVEWPGGSGSTTVEWTFTDRPDGTTYVSIVNRGFTGEDSQRVTEALDSTEGFSFVLAGAKAYLEHGIRLNLVQDKFPDGLPEG